MRGAFQAHKGNRIYFHYNSRDGEMHHGEHLSKSSPIYGEA